MSNKKFFLYSLVASIVVLGACSKQVSNSTGWNYNDSRNGGFQKYDDYYEQETGPGLVLVEGGSFMMGQVQQDVMYDWNNMSRKVSVSSFYMDETEVRNLDYREYLHWISRVFSENRAVYWAALPDTLVWRNKLAYNEPMVEHYFRHPAYQNYPVVGVSWLQASDYCIWRTDRVNERILIREGILNENIDQSGIENFNTEAYLNGLYEGSVRANVQDFNPNNSEGTRPVRMEDGILLPKYRLPTEAEWEFAALALIGNSIDERIYERRIFPWNGHYTRNPAVKQRGKMMANFTRGRGDQMGVAGRLNDAADITAPVLSYWPNDYGLYCMAGNVNEWVLDVYRSYSFDDVNEFRPFRGNVFTKFELGEEGQGTFAERDSLGRMVRVPITTEDGFGRTNYRQADNINYLDGDRQSTINYQDELAEDATEVAGSTLMYQQRDTPEELYAAEGWFTLVNDHSRVYKGGGWKDRAYYLSPGSRRFLDERKAADDLGFRCAMTRVGKPTAY
ncbi:MAG: gliding motility lipoprotein GldJ [Bacteroidales bacterium]|jgi:gliding motility-associated lipoprotein GldJ|nr:gliding motility lipoprotein GldJ [Bacteroidales bacterium]